MPRLGCNGFSLFAEQMRGSLEELKGKSLAKFNELISAAGPFWQGLAEEEKREWKDRARHYKRSDFYHAKKKSQRHRRHSRQRRFAISARSDIASRPRLHESDLAPSDTLDPLELPGPVQPPLPPLPHSNANANASLQSPPALPPIPLPLPLQVPVSVPPPPFPPPPAPLLSSMPPPLASLPNVSRPPVVLSPQTQSKGPPQVSSAPTPPAPQQTPTPTPTPNRAPPLNAASAPSVGVMDLVAGSPSVVSKALARLGLIGPSGRVLPQARILLPPPPNLPRARPNPSSNSIFSSSASELDDRQAFLIPASRCSCPKPSRTRAKKGKKQPRPVAAHQAEPPLLLHYDADDEYE